MTQIALLPYPSERPRRTVTLAHCQGNGSQKHFGAEWETPLDLGLGLCEHVGKPWVKRLFGPRCVVYRGWTAALSDHGRVPGPA